MMANNGASSGSGGESRRIVVVDVYNEFSNSSETASECASSRNLNEEQRQSRQKINGSAALRVSPITSANGVSRNNLGSAETVKVNGHHSEKSATSQSDFVTVLRVDDTSEECLQKTRSDRRLEELNSGNEQNFVTILQVNEMMKANGSIVASTNGTTVTTRASRSSHVIDIVTVYRLPGERLGMALKFEGGDANTTAPVSKVLIQSIQPESPAARAESNGSLLGCLQEGDTILDIDGREVTTLTRLDCVSLLREASVCIKLKVKREFISHEESVSAQNEDTEDVRPKLPAKKKGAPPPIPPRKTACLSQSPTLSSFVKDFASVEGVKEKIQRLECVQSTSLSISSEKVLKRPSHPPPLPPRRPRTGSESTSDSEEAEKTPTFPGGSLSMRLPGWEELMQRRAERFVENQNHGLPAQPSVYVDLFAEEDDKRGIESESDDTGSSVSTVIEKFSRGSTANSSFSEIHHGSSSVPQFDLKQVLSPFEQLERELDEAAQSGIADDERDSLTRNTQTASDKVEIAILPPESFQDGALNILASNSLYKAGNSPISPPGDSGFAEDLEDEEESDIKYPSAPLIFPGVDQELTNLKIESQQMEINDDDLKNDILSTDNEEFVDSPEILAQNRKASDNYQNIKGFVDDISRTNQDYVNVKGLTSEDENEEYVDGPMDAEVEKYTVNIESAPPAVPQKREVPKPPPVPPRLSIPKTSRKSHDKIVPPKTPDPKEKPRAAKVIPTSLLEPTVVGAIEKKQPTVQVSPDRSRKAAFNNTPRTTDGVKLRAKTHSKENSSGRRPRSLILSETSKSGSDHNVVARPRSLSLEDAEGTLMSRLQEIDSPATSSALPSKIPRPTFLTSPITSLERGNFTFNERSSSASVSRSNSLTAIDREPTSLPSNLNGDRKGILLSRSESLRSCVVEATETTITKVVKGKDNSLVVQHNTVTECKGNETRTVRSSSSRFGFVEKSEGRRVNFTRSSSSNARINGTHKNNDTASSKSNEGSKKKLVRSHSAQGELGRRSKDDPTAKESPKIKRETETKAKESVKSSTEPLKTTWSDYDKKQRGGKESETDAKRPAAEIQRGLLSNVETTNFDAQDEDTATKLRDISTTKDTKVSTHQDGSRPLPTNDTTVEEIVENRKMERETEAITVTPSCSTEARLLDEEIKEPEVVEESKTTDNLEDRSERASLLEVDAKEPAPTEIVEAASKETEAKNAIPREFYESTVEVINPAFQEHYDSWLASSFQKNVQAELQGEVLILGPSTNTDDSPESSLLDDVLRTEEEALQFRVEVGMPQDHNGGSEIIELQPGQTSLGFFNQRSVDPFSGENACKSSFAWNLSRWPLQDVPEEDEPVEEEQEEPNESDITEANPRDHSDGKRTKIGDTEEIHREKFSPKSREGSIVDQDRTTEIGEERPLAEGSSPVSADSNKSLLTDVEGGETVAPIDQPEFEGKSKEIPEGRHRKSNSIPEGERLEERKESSDEMDIYLSGPLSYRVNQHQVVTNQSGEVLESYRDLKLSPPPPPTYSRAPPDGHEFPPNYCEPAVPPPPASLPPSMPTVGGDKCPSGEKATLVRESSSSSLSRSFSLSSPPEYLAKEGLTSDAKGSYKETIAFHNHRNQQNGTLPARLTNGSNNRWNSEECLSKNAQNGNAPGGRLFSRRESEKSPSVRDRIALFSKPDVPIKTAQVQQTTVFTTTSKSVSLATPRREYAPVKEEEERSKPLTNGDAKDATETRPTNGVPVNEPVILRSKKEELILAKPNQESISPPLQPASPARRESSPYVSNYPQTQLTRKRFSYGGQKSGEDVGRRSSLGSYPPPYLESRRQSTTKLKGLVIPDKATFASKAENRLPTIIRSSSVTASFVNSYEKPVTSLSEANTFQARSDMVVEAAKPSLAVSLDSQTAARKHQSRVSAVQKEHQPAFKSHSLDLPKTVAMTSSVASTVSSSSMSSLTATQTNGSKLSTFQFSLSHSKPVTPTLPEKPIIVSPTPSSTSSSSLHDPPTEKPSSKTTVSPSVEASPPPLPASRPPNTSPRETTSDKDINQNSLALSNKTETQYLDFKQSTNTDPVKSTTNANKLSALDRLDSLVLTNSLANKTNEEIKFDSTTNDNSRTNNNVNLNNNIINARHQTYVEQVISREDILSIASNGGAMTPDFMSCGSSVFSNSSTSDSRLWSIRPSESDDDTNSVISLRTEDSRQTADDSMSDATTDSMDRLNSDLKPRRLSQQKTVLRASMDSADSVKNFRALAERWEMRAVDSDSSARSTPNGPSPVSALPLTRRESAKSVSPTITDSSFKLPPSLLPRNGLESVDGKDKPSSPTGKCSRETRSNSVNNDSWSSAFVKERLESSSNDRGKIAAVLERSVSSFNLDTAAKSLDTTNNKVNRAVSYSSGIGKSNRSISVSDIRKTFESQTKVESVPKIPGTESLERNDILIYNHSSSNGGLSSYALSKESRSSSALLPTTTTTANPEIHHKRFSSMDSTASDSGVSTPAHYGSTSSLAAPSTGSREHFGSVTSLASTSSLISPQELQQLIDEANQSLNEELSSSGGSAGHDISVVVLHKDSLTGGVGITLAGGADYETKEITIHKIITGSLADRDDRLRKGDRIVSINGKNLRGVTHREALDILKSPRQEVVLVISRERQIAGSPIESVRHPTPDQGLNQITQSRGERTVSQSTNLQPRLTALSSLTENTASTKANIPLDIGNNQNTNTSMASQSGSHVMIQLKKDGSGLGFSLEGGKDSPFGDKPLIVKRVFKGGAADKEGTLKATNEIISVNHQSVINMTRTEAWNFMKKLSDGPVSIVIRKS